MTPKELVEEYQCPGCLKGPYSKCYIQGNDISCIKHVPSTYISGIGKIFLGLFKGFNRIGPCDKTLIYIFNSIKDGWEYDILNIPTWKILDQNKNTIVRGISPRTNIPWIHIFNGNYMDKIDCYEITYKFLDTID